MKRLFLPLVLLGLSACSMNPPAKPDPEFVAIRPIVSMPPPAEDGSLYQAGYGMSLFSDRKAMQVGDLITVILQERTQASKSNSAQSSKQSTAELPGPTLMGRPITVNGVEVFSASLGSQSDFNGSGKAQQSNSLTGQITVTVSEVLPNGNLIVQGEKRLSLTEGSEHIRFAGIVRPEDVRSDNTVLSSNVANAQIIYGGTGSLANASSPGWLTRIFNSPWWPF